MFSSFTGEIPQKIDGKGRVSIPADFRGVLEVGDPDYRPGDPNRLVLQYSDEQKDHLRGWSVEAIERIRSKIRRMPSGPAKTAMTFYYFTQTQVLNVDRDGRTVVPLRFREKLGMTEGELSFLGFGDYFEIWKAETFTGSKQAAIADWRAAQPEDFDMLSLLDGIPETPEPVE